MQEEVALNDSSEHNKGELVLFLKVPTGPRQDRETERERVKQHLKDKLFKVKNEKQNTTLV